MASKVRNKQLAPNFFSFFDFFKTKVLWSLGLKNMIFETIARTRFSLPLKRLHLKKTYFFPLKKPLAFSKPRYSCNFHFLNVTNKH